MKEKRWIFRVLALTLGEISPERPTLVRVHLQNSLCDLFGTRHSGCGCAQRRNARQGDPR